MKFKFSVVLLVLAMSVLLVLTGCKPAGDTSQEDEVFELQMATFWPDGDFQVAEGHMAWIKEIEERTNGRVKITMHAGSSLLSPPELYEGVVDGVADIVTTGPAYTPGVFPVTEAFELPIYNNDNALVASLTVQEGFEKLKEQGLMSEYDDTKVLMFWATGPGSIKTHDPVRSLEDLSGMEIRSAGGGSTPTIAALGAVPVGMPMSAAYEALDAGVVQGILGPYDVLKGFRIVEVVDYATTTPYLYNFIFIKTMNIDTWNSLPADIQQVFEEVSQEYVTEYGKLRTDHTVAGLEFGIEEGLEVIDLSPEEDAKFRESVSLVGENWIKEREAQGIPAREIVELIQELDEKYSKEFGDY